MIQVYLHCYIATEHLTERFIDPSQEIHRWMNTY